MSDPVPSEEFEFREEGLAEGYLSQATDALLSSGRRSALYPKRALDSEERDAHQMVIRRMMAASRRLDFSRTAVLFAALAAEAYINLFLAEGLATRKDRDAIDRLRTPEKYVVGSRLVLGLSILHHDQVPMDDINRLFKLRNQLVHPKSRLVKVRRHHLFDRPGYEDYNPESAARFITSVAVAVAQLREASDPPDEPDDLVARLIEGRRSLIDYGKSVRDNLPDAPYRRIRRSLRAADRA